MMHFAPQNSPFHTTIKPVSHVGAGFLFIRFYLKRCMPTVYASPPKLAYLRPEALSDENIAVFSSYAGYLFISPLHILYIYTHPAPCFSYTRLRMLARPLHPHLGPQFTARHAHHQLTPSPPPTCTYTRATSF